MKNSSRVLLALTAACVAAARIDAQGPTGLAMPRTVEAAEAEGAVFPKGPASDSGRSRLMAAPGTDERTCVAVPEAYGPNSRRAGDFTIGGDIGMLVGGRENKVFWVPLHDPFEPRTTLVVRAALLGSGDTSGDTVRWTSTNYAWPSAGPGAHASPYSFFPSGFTWPRAGRWLVVATSGPDWGCFIVVVR